MSFFVKNEKKFLIAFLVVFALVHLFGSLYLAHRKTSFFLHHDGAEYLELAESYANHGRLISEKSRYYETFRDAPIPEAFRIQLLSVFTGILIFIGFSPLAAAALFSAVVAVLLALVIYAVSKKLSGTALAGWISLLIFTIHPLFAQLTFQFCCEPLCSLFILCFLLLFIDDPSFNRPFLMSVCILGAAYTRASTFLLFPFVGLIALVCGLRISKGFSSYLKSKEFKNLVVFTLTACCVAFSVGFRNYLYFHSFSLAGFEGGFGFFHGNNRYTLKAMQAANWQDYLSYEDKSWDLTFETVRNLPREEFSCHPEKQSKYMLHLALDELADMTVSEKIFLFARKLIHFVQPNPMTRSHHPVLYWGLTVFCSLLFLSGIIGAAILWKTRKMEVCALFSLMLCGMIVYTAFLVNMRYRVPYIDLSCILLAGGISLVKWHDKQKP